MSNDRPPDGQAASAPPAGLPRRIGHVSRVCAEVAGWLVIPMMLTIFLDAVLRSLFDVAVAGVIELNALLLVALVYLGLAGAQASGGHFRVTLISSRLHPVLRQAVNGLGYLLVLLTIVAVLWFTAQAAWFSYEREEVSYGLIDFPIWPSRLLIALGFLMLLVQYLADGVLLLTTGRDPFLRSDADSAH